MALSNVCIHRGRDAEAGAENLDPGAPGAGSWARLGDLLDAGYRLADLRGDVTVSWDPDQVGPTTSYRPAADERWKAADGSGSGSETAPSSGSDDSAGPDTADD